MRATGSWGSFPAASPASGLLPLTQPLIMEKKPVSDTAETEPAIVIALRRLPLAEQHRLLEWSRGWGEIRYGQLRGMSKIAAMFALTRDNQAFWPLTKLMSLALKVVIWDARSWTFRLILWPLVVLFVVNGNAAAGIVPLGGGIGLPLWTLIGAGGALVGLLADKIQALRQRSRT